MAFDGRQKDMPSMIDKPISRKKGLRENWPIPASFSFLIVISVVYWELLPCESGDMLAFLYPWFSRILIDGFPAMAGDYANYSPPYLYLLGLASLFSSIAPPIFLIKSISILFSVFAALIFGLIVMKVSCNRNLAVGSACFFLLIPSVAINAAWWGQCDVIYTSLMLCAFLASLKRRPFLVMVFFSMSLAFKAQAIFLGPYLLYLVLKKELPLKYVTVVPLVYACMLMPAWLAGRPALELASIYLQQGEYYKALSMHVPNPWALVEKYHLIRYKVGVITGMLVAVIANLALVVKAIKSGQDEVKTKLLLITATMIASPYLLPKMHDRYFFPADVFTVLLCVLFPKYWVSAVAMQVASTAVYLAFLNGTNHQQDNVAILASVFTTISLIWVLYAPALLRRFSIAAAPIEGYQ
jgi:Gpi18-like mannosyltransferase